MTTVNQTTLPGVGIRYDFTTKSGDLIGVIAHHTGRYDFLVYDHDDPDSCANVVRLETEDARTLTELLGAAQIAESAAELRQSLPGLTIDWVPIADNWPCVSRTIQDLDIRRHTGVSIVAVVRGGETIATPGPDFRLEAGDTAVVVGTPDGIRRTFALLQGD